MEGWIKLYRKTLENPIVCKDSDHLAIWIYLLLNATHKEHPGMFGGKKVNLKPGQLITGRKSIADKLHISESKVQRVLKLFENEHQIEQQSSNKNRLITVLSWNEYQINEQQDGHELNNKWTTTEQQVNTYKNYKNDKNERIKNNNSSDFINPTTAHFLKEYDSHLIKEIEHVLVTFYECYREYKGKEHPKLKEEQLERIYREIDRSIQEFCSIDEEMIRYYFNEVKKTDYNLNHFATRGILSNVHHRTM